MTASFTLTLDTKPPSNPLLEIDYANPVTGSRLVTVRLSSPDTDLSQMKVWGDVDPSSDISFQAMEGDSAWLPHADYFLLTLSEGAGHKTLYARLQDDVCNVTVPVSKSILFDPLVPVVEVTSGVDRDRVSKQEPCNTASFTWQVSQDFDAYEVRVVPSKAASRTLGVVIPEGSSINVQGGAHSAAEQIVTTISGDDLEAASPGDTLKIVKVFVRSLTGVWSV